MDDGAEVVAFLPCHCELFPRYLARLVKCGVLNRDIVIRDAGYHDGMLN